ncbi:LuxR family maltose regulon positive regulatory protein [Arthrobacter sp. V4I6]|uniref:LuxR C-terminal-related transcriptional regulator n=1 Tax=unclassified Arthrobacter TaxID=235627 RepID=UPI0027897173|nr:MULTISPECIES: LuxR C-terminal-related transcriptional regulator [unclassified Arthrobacter]MDQ0820990.1 LuxR family maltose regulon positive regulatory protein [Arthrobacter sp. V1I7]MDQ0855251.1 LuxR family maltose regulon positive regulatory protein [Arthrobacter sp. V4I6]
MPTPVLAPKLFVPAPRPQIVARPRLLMRLHGELGSGRKLTLVCAPAGFGKTTLLSAWIAERRRHNPAARLAWLSLDEGDNDVSRFLTYVVAALQGTDAEIGSEVTGLVQSDQVLPVELALTSLINGVARSGKEFILVLDDYHVIDARPIHEALVFLLDNLPSQLHLAIASRSDPPLSLARLRSRGELNEFRASDLRFTPDETADFLNQVMGLGLSTDDIAALETRTEGWIAGLQLAALSLREHGDVSGFIQAFTGSHRFIVDYLVEEVLQRQSDEVRSFLLHTAVLNRLTGPLCEAVTGVRGGSAMLEALERENLFVVPLDDSRQWYRYHHLFAEVLRARVRKELPDRAPALHRLASEWYERNDLPEEAVRHALAAEDFERAAGLIESVLPAMRRTRQDAMVLGWLRALPDEVVRTRPVLSVFCAWRMLVSGDLEAAESWLRIAEQGLEALAGGGEVPRDPAQASVREQELHTLPSIIAMYRASLAQARGDVAGTAEHARQAFELTQPGDHFARGAAAAFLGLAAWAQGDLDTAVRTFSGAVVSLHEAGNLTDELSSTILLADMWIARGQLQEARRIYERALKQAAAQGDPVPRATAELHVGFSELRREFDDLESATQHLQTSTALSRRAAPLTEHGYRWFVAMARVREVEGNLEGAIESLDQAERLYLRGFFPEVRPIAALKARVRIRQGMVPEGLEWARSCGLSAAGDLSYLREFEHITLARLLIAQYRLRPAESTIGEALGLLLRLLHAAEASGRNASTYEILVLQALALQAQGKRSPALVPLERALVEAGPEGYVRLFLDEGAPMAALLHEAGQQGIAPAFTGRLLRAFGKVGKETVTAAIPEPGSEGLSRRELHVLRLLDTPLSGPEIARELFVSVNTLRTHTKHIFAKFEVNSRPEAVRYGKERGLI